jgi:hypothetical protein
MTRSRIVAGGTSKPRPVGTAVRLRAGQNGRNYQSDPDAATREFFGSRTLQRPIRKRRILSPPPPLFGSALKAAESQTKQIFSARRLSVSRAGGGRRRLTLQRPNRINVRKQK